MNPAPDSNIQLSKIKTDRSGRAVVLLILRNEARLCCLLAIAALKWRNEASVGSCQPGEFLEPLFGRVVRRFIVLD